MNWMDLEESVLVRQMLAGKDEAFETFFDTYYPPLYRFALARLHGNADAAEEAAQSTLCKAILKLETFRGESRLFIWLRTFCRHEIFAWHEKHEMEALHQTLEAEDPALGEALQLLQDGVSNPEEHQRRLKKKETPAEKKERPPVSSCRAWPFAPSAVFRERRAPILEPAVRERAFLEMGV